MDGASPIADSLWQKVRALKQAGQWVLPVKSSIAALSPLAVKHPEYQKPQAARVGARVAAKPRTVTKGWALQWANQRGLCTDGVLDMDVVNNKAHALGLPGFVLDAPTSRRVA